MTIRGQRRWYPRLFREAPGRRRAGYRPWLEALEDRTAPSTLTATTNADSGTGSLRANSGAFP